MPNRNVVVGVVKPLRGDPRVGGKVDEGPIDPRSMVRLQASMLDVYEKQIKEIHRGCTVLTKENRRLVDLVVYLAGRLGLSGPEVMKLPKCERKLLQKIRDRRSQKDEI